MYYVGPIYTTHMGGMNVGALIGKADFYFLLVSLFVFFSY